MKYKKYTYIAADWDHDKEVVDQLYNWNKSPKSPVSFADAHKITQARDESLNCSIKGSLRKRLEQSSKFILIVGKHTKSLTKGGCQLCESYNSYTRHCARNRGCDTRSFIEYECEMAIELMLDILVLYNSSKVDETLCPDTIANFLYAEHLSLYKYREPIFTFNREGLAALGWGIHGKMIKCYNETEIADFLSR